MKKMKNRMIVMMMTIVIILMIVSSLAGCITPFTDDDVVKEPEINYDYETEWFNDTYEFTSILRMGQMNQYVSDYSGNNSSLTVYLNFTYRFEDRTLGQTGYLNLTLEPANSTGDIYYSQEWSGEEETVNETVTLTDIDDAIQLRIRAEGSGEGVSGEQQDYYDLMSTYHFTTLNYTA